jgi:hypothetical protein
MQQSHFWELNVGHLITIAIFLLGVGGSYVKLTRELQEMKTKLDLLFDWFQDNIINAKHKVHGHGD